MAPRAYNQEGLYRKGGGGRAGAYNRYISSVYRLTGTSIAGGGL